MKIKISKSIVLYFILLVLGASGFFFIIFLPHPIGLYATITVAALSGLSVCVSIYDTKRKNQQLVCPTGSDCNAVVNSRYSNFFGVSLEYWGMAYFIIIATSYPMLIFAREVFTLPMFTTLVLFSVAAGLFSLYLLFVQAFLLNKWCIWCLLVAMLSLSITVLSLSNAEVAVMVLRQSSVALAMITFLGYAFGVGGATASMFLFLRFLSDASIDDKELDVIKGISEMIWLGFVLVLMSQFAFYIAFPLELGQSAAFVIRIVSLLVFAVSSAALMIIYAPFLVYMPFQRVKKGQSNASFASLRRPATVLGVVAITSWYFSFITNFMPEFPIQDLSFIFIGVLVIAVIIAIFLEHHLCWNTSTAKEEGRDVQG